MGYRLDQLLAELQGGDSERKVHALQWIATELDPDDLPRVITEVRRLSSDPDPYVRYNARLALDEAERRNALPLAPPPQDEQTIVALLSDPLPENRLKGVLSAYTVRSDLLFDVLCRILRREPDAWVRASLVKAVAGYKRQKSLPLLAKFLTDPDGRVRANTVEALANQDNPVLTSKIAEMIDDPEHRVQSAVLTALGKGREGDIRPRIEAMLASERVWLQASAVYVLQQTQPSWACDVLREAVETHVRDRRLRERVANLIYVLQRRAGSGPIAELPGKLRDESEEDTSPAAGRRPKEPQ